MRKVVVASNNQKKLNELRHSLPPSFELLPGSDFNLDSPAETGTTFVENAIIKARHACRVTGLAAIADDSGLEVDYLKGAPGIYSSRYAGVLATDAENNHKLLAELEGVKKEHRTGRFRCVIVMLRHELDPMPVVATGTWEGEILTRNQGHNGFGYDPLFLVPELGISAAQLTPQHKNKLSHRGQAITRLQKLINSQ
ncbi:MAG: RdgB/HAM1 family non-canonical purine NTP pyrophosphatase [bacterium]|nr:RdgB/HAM1 family non-canonical purine NTP pyrophosphatase [Gammaproteobacteria bacterium]HIL99050.1 RdgB/HAM1 family non-canonical purine NTP pyrophosphatase [Pseudomonadales bacterium]